MIDERSLYGDGFVDGVVAIRYYREFECEEDAICDLLEDVFFAKFNAIERWAGDMNCRITHERAWRIHDAFCEALDLTAALAALRKLQALCEGRCEDRRQRVIAHTT